jgi:hypothetical protein
MLNLNQDFIAYYKPQYLFFVFLFLTPLQYPLFLFFSCIKKIITFFFFHASKQLYLSEFSHLKLDSPFSFSNLDK